MTATSIDVKDLSKTGEVGIEIAEAMLSLVKAESGISHLPIGSYD